MISGSNFDDPFDDLFETALPNVDEDVVDVILIDDSTMTLQMVEPMLCSIPGVRPKTFTNPVLALSHILRQKPALVIVDQQMPQMKGIELIKKVRETFDKFSLPVIMITGLEDHQILQEAFEAGVTDFIPKPIAHLPLVTRVSAQLEAAEKIANLQAEIDRLKGHA